MTLGKIVLELRLGRTVSSIITTTWMVYWFLIAECSTQGMMEIETSVGGPLRGYELVTRQQPPDKIKILQTDVIALYLFD